MLRGTAAETATAKLHHGVSLAPKAQSLMAQEFDSTCTNESRNTTGRVGSFSVHSCRLSARNDSSCCAERYTLASDQQRCHRFQSSILYTGRQCR